MIEKWVAEALADDEHGMSLVAPQEIYQWFRDGRGPLTPPLKEIYDRLYAVAQLPKDSAAFSRQAYDLWRLFNADAKTVRLYAWFLLDEKSRAKWAALTEKVVAVPAAKPDMTKREGPSSYVDRLAAQNKAAIDSALMASVSTAFNEANHASLLRHLGFPVQPPKTLAERQLDRIREMPPIIRAMSQNSLAWIVGSRAEFRPEKLRVGKDSDWDVLVPFSEWQDAMTRLAAAGALECATHTSVGGIRTVIPAKNGGTVKLDIWPGEISSHMMKPFTNVAWQPKTGAVWVRQH